MHRAAFVCANYFTVVKAFCSACLLLVCGEMFSQQLSVRELLFMKNHVAAGVELPFLLSQIEEQQGIGALKMRVLPGFALKVEYAYNFNSYISLASGSKFGMQVFGYTAQAVAAEFLISRDLQRKYHQLIPFFTIPLVLTPRVFISPRSFLQADVGGAVTFFMPGNSLRLMNYRNGAAAQQVFEMNVHIAEPPQVTLHIALSHGLVMRNGNILKTVMAYDFGRRKMMTGEYRFHSHDVTVGSGRVSSSLNHLSIGFTYVFTRAAELRNN